VALCALIDLGCETRPLMGSGRETIEAGPKAHKPADSGAVVGNGARMCSLSECLEMCFKHLRLTLTQASRSTRSARPINALDFPVLGIESINLPVY
jgi:hypothetical protein